MENNNLVPKKLELLWTITKVADYFSISKATVWRWIKRKEKFTPGTVVNIGTEHNPLYRIPRSEVERLAGVASDTIMSEVMAQTEKEQNS